MKEQIKQNAKKFLYYSGYYSLLERLHAPSEHRLLIIMLHDIVRDEEWASTWYNAVSHSESQLEAMFVAIKKRFRVITVEDAVQEFKTHGMLKEKSIAITFDDGYRSTYEIVFPLLKKHGVTATTYIPTGWINGEITPWWLTLTGTIEHSVLEPSMVSAIEKIIGTSVDPRIATLGNSGQAKRFLDDALGGMLMRQEDKTRRKMLQDIYQVLNEGKDYQPRIERPMTWEQIKDMAAHGNRFGAHTCTHPNLSFVDMETAEREIGESKRIIEQRLGQEVLGFAYPYGYDVAGYQRLENLLQKLGFLYACTSWWGHVDRNSDFYRLRRTGVVISTSPAIIGRDLGIQYCDKQMPLTLQPRNASH